MGGGINNCKVWAIDRLVCHTESVTWVAVGIDADVATVEYWKCGQLPVF
jgi:hypothetical protein